MPGRITQHQLIITAVLLIVGCALLLVGWAHPCGLLLTHDSRQYLAAATSFRECFQWLGTDGQPITYWPPLFPVLLSVFRNPVSAVGLFHYALMLTLGLQLWHLCKWCLNNQWLVTAFFIFIFLGVHLVLISVFLWSELLFVVLALAFITFLFQYTRPYHLWYAAGFGFLMCLQRHAGVFVVAGAVTWFFFRQPSWPQALRCLLFFVVATAGTWLWNIYVSFFVATDFRFYQHEFGQHMLHNLQFMLHALFRAFAPLPYTLTWMVLAFAGGLLFFARQKQKHTLIQLLLLIITAYMAGMVLQFKLDVYDGDRYVAVILPLVGLVFFYLADQWFETAHRRGRLLLVIILAMVLSYNGFRTMKNARLWRTMSCQAETTK